MTDTETTEEPVEPDKQPKPAPEPDDTERVLWTWGLSGEPSSWALSTWTSLIDVIRAVNRGDMNPSAVQDALDTLYPDAGYQAANVCLAHPPLGTFSVTVGEANRDVRVDLDGDEDLGLPDENVQWDFGDGTLVNDAGGWDHTYAADGEYQIRLYIMVAGARYGQGDTVTIGEAGREASVDPGYDARDATVFESETDELPNTTVTPEQSDAQAEAVAAYIAGEETGAEVADVSPDAAEATGNGGAYDPGAHTVDEVLAYAADHPDEVNAIAAAEEAGKNRSTLLDRL